jgi:uncharacterized membrane protein
VSHEQIRRALVVAAFGISASVVAFLPGSLPRAFGVPPGVDAWVSRLLSAFFLPAAAMLFVTLLQRLAAADPDRANYRRFASTFNLVLDAVVIAILGLHATLLATLLVGVHPWLGRVPPLLVGILVVVVGNAIPRVRPNAVVGIPTAWARRSERAWAHAHRVGGYVLVLFGVAIIVSTFLLGRGLGLLVGAGAGATALVLVLVSWWASRVEGGPWNDLASHDASSSRR